MKRLIRLFYDIINRMSTRSIINILILVAIVPYLILIILVISLNLEFSLTITGFSVMFGVIIYIIGSVITIIRKEIPVYPPLQPIRGKWAVLLGGFQVALLSIVLILLIKVLLETSH